MHDNTTSLNDPYQTLCDPVVQHDGCVDSDLLHYSKHIAIIAFGISIFSLIGQALYLKDDLKGPLGTVYRYGVLMLLGGILRVAFTYALEDPAIPIKMFGYNVYLLLAFIATQEIAGRLAQVNSHLLSSENKYSRLLIEILISPIKRRSLLLPNIVLFLYGLSAWFYKEQQEQLQAYRVNIIILLIPLSIWTVIVAALSFWIKKTLIILLQERNKLTNIVASFANGGDSLSDVLGGDGFKVANMAQTRSDELALSKNVLNDDNEAINKRRRSILRSQTIEADNVNGNGNNGNNDNNLQQQQLQQQPNGLATVSISGDNINDMGSMSAKGSLSADDAASSHNGSNKRPQPALSSSSDAMALPPAGSFSSVAAPYPTPHSVRVPTRQRIGNNVIDQRSLGRLERTLFFTQQLTIILFSHACLMVFYVSAFDNIIHYPSWRLPILIFIDYIIPISFVLINLAMWYLVFRNKLLGLTDIFEEEKLAGRPNLGTNTRKKIVAKRYMANNSGTNNGDKMHISLPRSIRHAEVVVEEPNGVKEVDDYSGPRNAASKQVVLPNDANIEPRQEPTITVIVHEDIQPTLQQQNNQVLDKTSELTVLNTDSITKQSPSFTNLNAVGTITSIASLNGSLRGTNPLNNSTVMMSGSASHMIVPRKSDAASLAGSIRSMKMPQVDK